MTIGVQLSDEEKRALRYLGYSQDQLRNKMVQSFRKIMDNLVQEAKEKYADTKTMSEIDPAPLE